MNREIIFNGILCIIMIVLLTIYMVYIIVDERKKMKYYQRTLYYETNWDKYRTMVKRQKRILKLKKIELFGLLFLVKMKRLIKWK